MSEITILLHISNSPEIVHQIAEAILSPQESPRPQSEQELQQWLEQFDARLFPWIRGITFNTFQLEKGDLFCELSLIDPLAKVYVDSHKKAAIAITPQSVQYRDLGTTKIDTKPDYLREVENITPEERESLRQQFKEWILSARDVNHES
ncbi:hypothetical protein A6S26_05350 [Nostoc sp. ATCC 43529]|nr:hypothetical protein A6S26_05350 [Nostoc sp. ATCC 43529]